MAADRRTINRLEVIDAYLQQAYSALNNDMIRDGRVQVAAAHGALLLLLRDLRTAPVDDAMLGWQKAEMYPSQLPE